MTPKPCPTPPTGEPTDPPRVVTLFEWEYDAARLRAQDENAVAIGSALYGERYDAVELTYGARRKIDEAFQTVAWVEHFMCRFSTPPDNFPQDPR